MRKVGLTGGIGSGKTTISGMLEQAGFAVIDADAITRRLQQPGQRVLSEIVDAFGPEILLGDGNLDRQALATMVFGDAAQLHRLNSIVHPAVGTEIARQLQYLSDRMNLVILDVPLLVESGRNDLDLVVVVDIDPEIAVERLVRFRGFDPHDARARLANQASRADRLARADIVIDNSGTRNDLNPQVSDLVAHLRSLSD